MRALILAAATVACAPQPAPTPTPAPPAITTAAQLVSAMHDRYAGKWYPTLGFVQKNTRYLENGGTDTTTWSEVLSLPGKLQIGRAHV